MKRSIIYAQKLKKKIHTPNIGIKEHNIRQNTYEILIATPY